MLNHDLTSIEYFFVLFLFVVVVFFFGGGGVMKVIIATQRPMRNTPLHHLNLERFSMDCCTTKTKEIAVSWLSAANFSNN